MNRQEFKEALSQEGIELSEQQLDQFESYLKLLQEWNQKMNLTALDEESEIWQKHFLDSIRPFIHEDFESLIDVGSGAGFPGIPLQIVWPNRQITLLEPLQKRCTFLQAVKDELKLDNLEIVNDRAELYGKKNREKADLVSARAVARLSILLELMAPLAKVEGKLLALKGSRGDEELEAARKAVDELALQLEQKESYLLGDEKRMNFHFRKMKKTPNKYPRAYAQIKKRPLESA